MAMQVTPTCIARLPVVSLSKIISGDKCEYKILTRACEEFGFFYLELARQTTCPSISCRNLRSGGGVENERFSKQRHIWVSLIYLFSPTLLNMSLKV
jgi:hypothetical protein